MTSEMERFTLRIPKDTKTHLKAHSKKMCVSLNSLVIQILWDWAKKNPPTTDRPM